MIYSECRFVACEAVVLFTDEAEEQKAEQKALCTILTNTDFADDITVLSHNTIFQAQKLLYKVESACNSVELHLNSSKTKLPYST